MCSGFRFYLLLVDDFSPFSWVYLLKHKSDVHTCFTHFKTHLEHLLSTHIKILITNGGGEFTSTRFKQYLENNGIVHQLSCPYTLEQNNVAERKHGHLIVTTVAMLQTTFMSIKFWAEAVRTTAFLINQLPTPVLQNKSPFEKLFNTCLDYAMLRVFGCACYPWLRPYSSNKLEA